MAVPVDGGAGNFQGGAIVEVTGDEPPGDGVGAQGAVPTPRPSSPSPAAGSMSSGPSPATDGATSSSHRLPSRFDRQHEESVRQVKVR